MSFLLVCWVAPGFGWEVGNVLINLHPSCDPLEPLGNLFGDGLNRSWEPDDRLVHYQSTRLRHLEQVEARTKVVGTHCAAKQPS